MPISGKIKRGDAVQVRGRRWLVRPQGSATYLYGDESALAAERHTRTMATYVLRRDGSRDGETLVPATAEHSKALTKTAPLPKRRVREEEIRFLYVVRNCDLPRAIRELKIGITSDVPATLRTYHRLVPNAQALFVADCGGAARPLERELHRIFAAFRVDRSELFEVRAHEVRRSLSSCGFVRGKDGVFRRKESIYS